MEGYKYNLTLEQPSIFIVLRSTDDEEQEECEHDVYPFLVTVCPYEAQDYLDSGEEIVDNVSLEILDQSAVIASLEFTARKAIQFS